MRQRSTLVNQPRNHPLPPQRGQRRSSARPSIGQNVVRTCPTSHDTIVRTTGPTAILLRVRRALGTIFLTLGLLSASLALSAWWVQHTAFDTANTSTIAEAALQNPELRADLARGIADRVATELGVDHALVQTAADATLVRPDIATAFSSVLRDIHSRLIGQATGAGDRLP